MKLYQIIIMLAGLPFFAFSAYFFILALFGIKKSKVLRSSTPSKRFAIVAAARNEQEVIGKLIESLKAQDYPKHLYEIIIAPNNCTDNTEDAAKAHGARIFNHVGAVSSKGEVLTQVVDEIVLREDFDAFCVFDADNLAAPDFLQRMNNALCQGATVAQGFRDSKNPRQTAISGCYSIWYWMLNRFYNQSRKALGLSAVINGSGFAIDTEFLRKIGGWHTHTMTEDTEFSAQTALMGERVIFVPEALIYDEQPLTFSVSFMQRRRWITGSLQCLSGYGKKLFVKAIKEKSIIALDMLMSFLMPVVGIASFLYGALSCMMFGVGPMLFMLTASLITSAIGAIAVAAVTVKLKNASIRKMRRAVFSYWIFLGSWVFILISCLFKMQKKWEPIVHTKAVDLSEIQAA